MSSHNKDSVFAFGSAWIRHMRYHWRDIEGSVVWCQDDIPLVVADSNSHLALKDLEGFDLIEVDV